MKNNKKTAPFIVFLASLLWGVDAPFRQPLLVGGLSVAFVAFLEHVFNSLACLPGLWKKRFEFKTVTLKQWAGLFYIGAGSSALGAVLFVQAAVVMNYNFTIAALLQKFQPLFAILLAAVFLKEKVHLKFWLLALPAIVGAYLVTFGLVAPTVLWHTSGQINILGSILAILAALLWAGGTVVGRGLLKNLDLQFVNGMRFVFGFLFMTVYVAAVDHFQFALMTPLFWRNVLIITMLSGFFALLIYYYGLRHTKASIATLMELGYPLALTIVNWKFLGITLSPWQIVGTVILLISVTALVLLGSKENDDGKAAVLEPAAAVKI